MTISTIDTDRPSAISTSCTAPLTKTASSLVILIDMPSGKLFWMLGDGGLTRRSEMSSVLDSAWRMMPMPMPVLPSERSVVCPMSAPSVTVATSRDMGVVPPMHDVLERFRRGHVRRGAHDQVLIAGGQGAGRGIEGDRAPARCADRRP